MTKHETDRCEPPRKIIHNWPGPTSKMLASPEFEAVWQCIKTWDINVPDVYVGYCGATGNHVRAILDALGPALPPTELMRRLREPGVFNIHDLVVAFEEASLLAGRHDELSANPSRWPDVRGVRAVVAAVLDAIERELGNPPS